MPWYVKPLIMILPVLMSGVMFAGMYVLIQRLPDRRFASKAMRFRFMGVGALVMLSSLAGSLLAHFNVDIVPVTRAFCWAFISVSVLWLGVIAACLVRRTQAGRLLYKAGWPGHNIILLVAGAGCALIGIPLLIMMAPRAADRDLMIVAAAASLLAMGLTFLFMGPTPVMIHENGLIASGWLQKWGQILSYSWDPDKPYILRLEVPRRWFNPRTTRSLAIPPAQKGAVDQLLARHVNPGAVPGPTS